MKVDEHSFQKYFNSALPAALILTVLCGCSLPGLNERTENAVNFQNDILTETHQFFATNQVPLSLLDCRRIAKDRTLKLTEARLNEQLARSQRVRAFSAFIPQIEATYQRTGTSIPLRQNLVMGGSPSTIQMSDQYVTEAALTISQPVFVPSAWLLFSNANRNVRVQELVRERNEELLNVQVASLFYTAAVADQTVSTYERQYEATRSLAEQVDALADAGLVLSGERARVHAQLASDAYNRRLAIDRKNLTRANLLDILRLYPLAEAEIDGDSLLQVLALPWATTDAKGEQASVSRDDALNAPIEEWLWHALINRKEMWAGDIMIDVRKMEAIQALTQFLPTLSLTGGGAYTSESRMVKNEYFMGGIGGVMSILDGFNSIADYLAARDRTQAEYDLQADRASTLITSTYEAWQNWKQAFDRFEVAEKARTAAEIDYNETKERYDQDQETLTEVLNKLSAMESARIDAVNVHYAAALAELVFRDTIGLGFNLPDPGETQEAPLPPAPPADASASLMNDFAAR